MEAKESRLSEYLYQFLKVIKGLGHDSSYGSPQGPPYGAPMGKAGPTPQSLRGPSSMVLDYSLQAQAMGANFAPWKPLQNWAQGDLNCPHRPWAIKSQYGLKWVEMAIKAQIKEFFHIISGNRKTKMAPK
ncbi:hypothetical protein O181_028247 [Austropuccinia psidii MF-1]|uniref:Uncharacterized protein n=1 Tax=Austropuccinia psidii MF-1 TaxID=1389203 RepID=A0A9Q3H2E7_9BASI|nr:hypothetical protein [Austropuccinia psidii MF-1]